VAVPVAFDVAWVTPKGLALQTDYYSLPYRALVRLGDYLAVQKAELQFCQRAKRDFGFSQNGWERKFPAAIQYSAEC
jgi:hypothetical protein